MARELILSGGLFRLQIERAHVSVVGRRFLAEDVPRIPHLPQALFELDLARAFACVDRLQLTDGPDSALPREAIFQLSRRANLALLSRNARSQHHTTVQCLLRLRRVLILLLSLR